MDIFRWAVLVVLAIYGGVIVQLYFLGTRAARHIKDDQQYNIKIADELQEARRCLSEISKHVEGLQVAPDHADK